MPWADLSAVIIASIGNIFLGLFTYFKNYKSATNILFFLFTLSIAVYIVFNYLALHQALDEQTLFWIRMVISIAVVINLLFFLLVATFPKTKLQSNSNIFFTAIIFTLLMIPIIQSPLVFKGVNPSSTQPIPGIGLPLFLFHTVVFLGGGFIILLNKLKKSTGIEKNQLKLFLLGTIFMFVAILITNLLLVIIFNTTLLVGLLPVYTLVFLSCISYAIVKHRFLDINLLVARTVAYAVVILVVGGFYSLSIFLVGIRLFNLSFSWGQFVIYGILTIIVAFTFQPLRRSIERVTDTIFYKGFYDPQDLLKSLSAIMSSNIELEALTTKVLKKIAGEMRISYGTFVLFVKRGGQIDYVQYKSSDDAPVVPNTDVDELLQELRMIVFDEVDEGQIKNIMRRLRILVVMPMVVRSQILGMLIFGEKSSGDIYSNDDIKLLEIFTSEAAVAVQNSLAFEEIKLFNITLQDKINKATKELKDANQKLMQLDHLKDEFVSLASHELRTPMTAIKSYLWMVMEGKGGPITDKQKYYLDRAYISNSRLIKLVNDMLNVSRIESGRMTLDIGSADLIQVGEEVVNELLARAQELGVIIKIVPDASIPKVLGDTDKIKEVYYNLIGNSMKFTPSGGTITVTFTRTDGMVEVHVADTGKGIPKDDLTKLFQKFSLVGNEYLRKQNAQGTGLGLYISKSLIDMQGGRVWAESEGEDKGATFSFSLKVFAKEKAEEIVKLQEGREHVGVLHVSL